MTAMTLNHCGAFESSEGLRALLERLHREGDAAWHTDPQAAALMVHAAQRYASLAHKHGLDRWEAASAAFDAMRTPAVRRADDPWAVVTRAVQVTMIAEERANGLLCSTQRARRPEFSIFHDAERFSDRDQLAEPRYLANYDAHDLGSADGGALADGPTRVGSAVADTTRLLNLLGWPAELADAAVQHVCTRLADASSRMSACEALRRDTHTRVLLGISQSSWSGLLRAVLGHPDPQLINTNAGRGVLLRLLIGERLQDLLADDDLVVLVGDSAPTTELAA